MPLAAMFGVYVIMHGNSSPGGGFQGGVLMAITLLMFFLAYGWKGMEKTFHDGFLHNSESLAEIVYIAVGDGRHLCRISTSLWTLSCSDKWQIETTMIMNGAVGYHVMAAIICLQTVMLTVLHSDEDGLEEGSDQK